MSDDEEQAKAKQLKTWKSAPIEGNPTTVYIENFKGSPLSLEVSVFKQTRV